MREVRWAVALLVALGAFVFLMLVVGSLGGIRPELDPLTVNEVRDVGDPSAEFGPAELRIVGWYAELRGDCAGDDGGADASVAWLQRDCPLRVLLQEQPPPDVGQAELERLGIRLAAPLGRAFPPRPQPGGANLQLQPLVFVGHFADEASADCVPDRQPRCEDTFVVEDYDRFVR